MLTNADKEEIKENRLSLLKMSKQELAVEIMQVWDDIAWIEVGEMELKLRLKTAEAKIISLKNKITQRKN